MNKRLKKKAWEKIYLYHVTNSQLIFKIKESGQLLPGMFTDRVSHGIGSELIYRDISNSNIHEQDQIKKLSLDKIINDVDPKIQNTQELIDLANEMVKEIDEKYQNGEIQDYDNALRNTTIDIIEYENEASGENGVYLSSESNRELYRTSIWSNLPWPELPATSVELKINCNTDALGPDLDDGAVNKNSEIPPWKQTLNSIGQCIHYGPIDVDQIESVWVDDINARMFSDSQYVENKIKNLYLDIVPFNQWITLDEAVNQLQQFYNEYVNLVNELQEAYAKNNKKRLLRRG